MRTPIDLTPAGKDWDGWSLAPYGKAGSYRLITPNGEPLTAPEIRELRELQHDVRYLVTRGRILSRDLADSRAQFSETEAAALRLTMEVVQRMLGPAAPQRRRFAVSDGGGISSGEP